MRESRNDQRLKNCKKVKLCHSFVPGIISKIKIMKHTLFVALAFMVFISCKKNTPESAQEVLPAGTVLSSGSFVSSGHTTTGTAKKLLQQNQSGNHSLNI